MPERKEGAVNSLDTVLGSFLTPHYLLILVFFNSVTRTLWIWTSTDLGRLSDNTGNAQKKKKGEEENKEWLERIALCPTFETHSSNTTNSITP